MKTFILLLLVCLTALAIASEKYYCELARAQVDMERVEVERDRIRLEILRGIRPPTGSEDSHLPDTETPTKGL